MRINDLQLRSGEPLQHPGGAEEGGRDPRVTKTGLGIEDADGDHPPRGGELRPGSQGPPDGAPGTPSGRASPCSASAWASSSSFRRARRAQRRASPSWRAGSGGSPSAVEGPADRLEHSIEEENELVRRAPGRNHGCTMSTRTAPETEGGLWAATSTYGVEFPSLVAERSVYGTQFHPEKSGPAGRRSAELLEDGEEMTKSKSSCGLPSTC